MIVIKVKDTSISETRHKSDVRKLFNNNMSQTVHIKLRTCESL